jgi:hypothetical protein
MNAWNRWKKDSKILSEYLYHTHTKKGYNMIVFFVWYCYATALIGILVPNYAAASAVALFAFGLPYTLYGIMHVNQKRKEFYGE